MPRLVCGVYDFKLSLVRNGQVLECLDVTSKRMMSLLTARHRPIPSISRATLNHSSNSLSSYSDCSTSTTSTILPLNMSSQSQSSQEPRWVLNLLALLSWLPELTYLSPARPLVNTIPWRVPSLRQYAHITSPPHPAKFLLRLAMWLDCNLGCSLVKRSTARGRPNTTLPRPRDMRRASLTELVVTRIRLSALWLVTKPSKHRVGDTHRIAAHVLTCCSGNVRNEKGQTQQEINKPAWVSTVVYLVVVVP